MKNLWVLMLILWVNPGDKVKCLVSGWVSKEGKTYEVDNGLVAMLYALLLIVFKKLRINEAIRNIIL